MRVTTTSGQQFQLFRPSIEGDSLLIGLRTPTDSAATSIRLGSLRSIERFGGDPAGNIQVIAITGFLGLVVFLLTAGPIFV